MPSQRWPDMPLDRTLERDLDWRQSELTRLKIIIASADAEQKEGLLRALWSMLYAHYEGFCKFAIQAYLDEIQQLRLTRIVLSDTLNALSLESCFRLIKGDESLFNRAIFLAELRKRSFERAAFEGAPDTSNLWPEKLKQMLEAVGLDSDFVDEESHRLVALVARRNEIAHGKRNVIPSLLDYQTYEASTLNVMTGVALTVWDHFELRRYL